MKTKRPKLHTSKTVFERTLERLNLMLFIIWIAFLVISWPSIPAQIPGHFGFDGEITRWGAKWEIITLPIIAGTLSLFMSWISKHPEWHNYPIQITEDNAPFYYRLSRQMMAILSTTIMLSFAWLSWDIVQIAKGQSAFLNGWFMPVF